MPQEHVCPNGKSSVKALKAAQQGLAESVEQFSQAALHKVEGKPPLNVLCVPVCVL